MLLLLLPASGCRSRSKSTPSKPRAGTSAPRVKTPPERAVCANPPAPTIAKISDELAERSAVCLGFTADGESAYLLVMRHSGSNLELSRSYKVVRVDFASTKNKRIKDVFDIAYESDSADDKSTDQQQEGDAAERAEAKLRAARGRLNRLIKSKGLRACKRAKRETKRFIARLKRKTVTFSIAARPGAAAGSSEPFAPDRDVVVTAVGGRPRKLVKLEGGQPMGAQDLRGVFYSPCWSRVVLVRTVRDDDTTLFGFTL